MYNEYEVWIDWGIDVPLILANKPPTEAAIRPCESDEDFVVDVPQSSLSGIPFQETVILFDDICVTINVGTFSVSLDDMIELPIKSGDFMIFQSSITSP